MSIRRPPFATVLVFSMIAIACNQSSKSDSNTEDKSKREGTPGTNAVKQSGDGWHQLSVGDGRFEVRMPKQALPASQTANGKHGPIHFLMHKARSGSVFFNFNVVTYPAASIRDAGGGTTMLNKLAATMRLQKRGSKSEYLRTIADVGYPAVEHKFSFPAGASPSAGTPYAAGYAIHRMYLIDNKVVWLFVDVIDSLAKSDSDNTTADVRRFLDSLVISRK